MQFEVDARTLRSQVTEAYYLDTLTDEGELNWAGDCTAPVMIFLRGVSDQVLSFFREREPGTPDVVAWATVRCRKCNECRYTRRRAWTRRAMAECAVATRTWFGTLTLRPEDRVRYTYKAHLEASRKRVEQWCCLNDSEQFTYLVSAIGKELTRYIKRVRKNSGATLRYLLVSEEHKDGFPHFHMLVHECAGTVTKRQLDEAWRLGFSQWRLVAPGQGAKGARYVCKYLSKSALSRIRGSHKYGQMEGFLHSTAERLEAVTRALNESMSRDDGPSPNELAEKTKNKL